MVGLLGCLLVMTACASTGASHDATGSSGKGDDMRTLTTEQAAQRAKEHVKNAVAALPAQPSLSLQDPLTTECLDPDDNGPQGRYEVDRGYWLNDLPKERNTEVV